MKRILAVAAFLPGVAFSCGDLSTFNVSRLNFKQVPADQAIAATLRGTPLKAAFIGGTPTKPVNANDVSGPMGRVLGELGKQVGLVHVQAGCVVTFMPRENLVFTLAPGDLIHEALGAWLARNSYTLVWEANKYQAGGGVVLDKPLEDNLNEFAGFMQANGVKLSIEIYDNRVVRVVEVK